MSNHPTPTTPYGWLLPIAMALFGFGINGLIGYFHADATIAQRITAVEIRQQDTSSRLDRIENKVDRLLLAVVK